MIAIPVTVERLLATTPWTLREIIGLRHTVRQMIPERQRLEEHVRKGTGFPVATAAIDWVLDRRDEFEKKAAASDDTVVCLLRAISVCEAGKPLAAWRFAEKAAKGLKDAWADVVLADLALVAHQPDAAATRIEKLLVERPTDAGVAYLAGRLKEEQFLWQEALEHYERALSLAPGLAIAAFRRAYILDLRGVDDEALDGYQAAAVGRARFTGAMTNLGMIYEERNDIERAIACFRQVGRALAGNHHVRVLLEGAVETTQELFDEAERKELERVQRLLRTPISEFELSVRSRNCLHRMGIRTLWDLVQKNEEELLAHKNFGEVSLREVRQMLSARGLRLGMRRDLSTQKAVREMLSEGVEGGAADPELLSQTISSLELSTRAARALECLGARTLGELIRHTEDDLLRMPNFGQVSLEEVRDRLAQLGLSLRGKEPAPLAAPLDEGD